MPTPCLSTAFDIHLAACITLDVYNYQRSPLVFLSFLSTTGNARVGSSPSLHLFVALALFAAYFQVKPANKQYSTVMNDYELHFSDK